MKRLLLYVALALQICGLTGFYAWHARIPDARYLLRTRPIDPRDLLRGDYITLGYDISRPLKDAQPRDGHTVYVRLKADGRFWVADAIADAPKNDGAPWLRARWKGDWLDYSIDKYFVPEGRGNPPGKITVAIAIRPGGQAQIVQLYSDDRPWP